MAEAPMAEGAPPPPPSMDDAVRAMVAAHIVLVCLHAQCSWNERLRRAQEADARASRSAASKRPKTESTCGATPRLSWPAAIAPAHCRGHDAEQVTTCLLCSFSQAAGNDAASMEKHVRVTHEAECADHLTVLQDHHNRFQERAALAAARASLQIAEDERARWKAAAESAQERWGEALSASYSYENLTYHQRTRLAEAFATEAAKGIANCLEFEVRRVPTEKSSDAPQVDGDLRSINATYLQSLNGMGIDHAAGAGLPGAEESAPELGARLVTKAFIGIVNEVRSARKTPSSSDGVLPAKNFEFFLCLMLSWILQLANGLKKFPWKFAEHLQILMHSFAVSDMACELLAKLVPTVVSWNAVRKKMARVALKLARGVAKVVLYRGTSLIAQHDNNGIYKKSKSRQYLDDYRIEVVTQTAYTSFVVECDLAGGDVPNLIAQKEAKWAPYNDVKWADLNFDLMPGADGSKVTCVSQLLKPSTIPMKPHDSKSEQDYLDGERIGVAFDIVRAGFAGMTLRQDGALGDEIMQWEKVEPPLRKKTTQLTKCNSPNCLFFCSPDLRTCEGCCKILPTKDELKQTKADSELLQRIFSIPDSRFRFDVEATYVHVDEAQTFGENHVPKTFKFNEDPPSRTSAAVAELVLPGEHRLKLQVLTQCGPTIDVNPCSTNALKQVYTQHGETGCVRGFGFFKEEEVREWMYVTSDEAAADLKLLNTGEGDDLKFQRFRHINGHGHEFAVFLRLVMGILWNYGIKTWLVLYGYTDKPNVWSIVKSCASIHKSVQFLNDFRFAMSFSFYREYVAHLNDLVAEGKLTMADRESEAGNETLFWNWLHEDTDDVVFANLVQVVFHFLPALELMRKGMRNNAYSAYNAGRVFLLNFLILRGNWKYVPLVLREIITVGLRIPSIVLAEFIALFCYFGQGFDYRMEELIKRIKRVVTYGTKAEMSLSALLHDYVISIKDNVLKLLGLRGPGAPYGEYRERHDQKELARKILQLQTWQNRTLKKNPSRTTLVNLDSGEVLKQGSSLQDLQNSGERALETYARLYLKNQFGPEAPKIPSRFQMCAEDVPPKRPPTKRALAEKAAKAEAVRNRAARDEHAEGSSAAQGADDNVAPTCAGADIGQPAAAEIESEVDPAFEEGLEMDDSENEE